MATRAKGTFEVTNWDEKTYQELGGKAKLTQAAIDQDFRGDIEARVEWRVLMSYLEDGTAVYTGLGRVEGSVGGRSGSFVALSDGAFDGGKARSRWSVIPGSGTGKLKGLRGKGTWEAPHGSKGTFTLNYEIA